MTALAWVAALATVAVLGLASWRFVRTVDAATSWPVGR